MGRVEDGRSPPGRLVGPPRGDRRLGLRVGLEVGKHQEMVVVEQAIDQAVAEATAKLKAQGKPVLNEMAEQIAKSYTAKIPRPPFSILIDHIDHIAKIAGIDHVGLGSDFDGIPSSPEGMDSAADLPKITQALMARGYSAEDMEKILGGNFLRVFAKVQDVSKQLQAENRPRITEKQPFEKK